MHGDCEECGELIAGKSSHYVGGGDELHANQRAPLGVAPIIANLAWYTWAARPQNP